VVADGVLAAQDSLECGGHVGRVDFGYETVLAQMDPENGGSLGAGGSGSAKYRAVAAENDHHLGFAHSVQAGREVGASDQSSRLILHECLDFPGGEPGGKLKREPERFFLLGIDDQPYRFHTPRSFRVRRYRYGVRPNRSRLYFASA